MPDKDGIQIPLAIDTGLFIAGLIVAVTMWANLQAMADDIKELKKTPVTEARVVRIEEDVKHIKLAVDEIKTEQKEALEKILKKLDDD